MAKFEEHLDAQISKALTEAKLSDELYQRYVQFVGALDALPQDQIQTDRLGTDIHIFDANGNPGRLKPFSQWPTKSSRAKSEKVWLTYNQRLQLKQAGKEAGLEDPTDDPDFLGQMLDTCIRTSMKMGKLDRQTAFRHCSRQVERFEQAIRGALVDRGFTTKQVEEFTKELLRGMANGKQIDIKDLSIEDRQFIQDLKDSLTYKARSECKLNEDLTDKDEFVEPCNYCEGIFRWSPELTPEDQTEFHIAHVEWLRAPTEIGITEIMAQHGFVHVGKGERGSAYHWARKPLGEDLNDQDEFSNCDYCGRHTELDDIPRFHEAHLNATQITADGHMIRPGPFDMNPKFHEIMNKHGYVWGVDSNWQSRWMPLKEDLNDQDEFQPTCRYCLINYLEDDPKFHIDHIEAETAAENELKINYNANYRELFFAEMVRRGWCRDSGAQSAAKIWTKNPLHQSQPQSEK